MRDNAGAAFASWRITVRQLESLIRLSEALARLRCSDKVEPKDVKEACRLLNKSIIRVEQPDVQLDEEEEEADLLKPTGEAEADESMEVKEFGFGGAGVTRVY